MVYVVEVEMMRLGWQGNHVERTRPVVAVAAIVFESVVFAVSRSGQEETVAVGSGEQATVHAILLCPGAGRVVFEFLKLRLGSTFPSKTPEVCFLHCGKPKTRAIAAKIMIVFFIFSSPY